MNYDEIFGINQSSLKDWTTMTPRQWKMKYIDKTHTIKEQKFTYGTLLDTLMFTPSTFNDKFYVGGFDIPSQSIATIVTDIYNEVWDSSENGPPIKSATTLDQVDPEIILRNIEKEGWNKGWKNDTRIQHIINKGGIYFKELLKIGSKILIDNKTLEKAYRQKEILENNPFTKDYFVKTDSIDLDYQVIIIDEFHTEDDEAIPVKAALDIKKANKDLETIHFADLKTTSVHISEVSKEIRKYRYAIQASFYQTFFEHWVRSSEYSSYRLERPRYIFIDPYDNVDIFEFSQKDLDVARNGNSQIRGWISIFDEVSWHLKHDMWDYSKDLYLYGYKETKLYD